MTLNSGLAAVGINYNTLIMTLRECLKGVLGPIPQVVPWAHISLLKPCIKHGIKGMLALELVGIQAGERGRVAPLLVCL